MFRELSESEEKILQYAIDNEVSKDTGFDIKIDSMEYSELLDIIKRLDNDGFVRNVSSLDTVTIFLKQLGRNYFHDKKSFNKKQKKILWQKWRLDLTSVIIGAVIGALISWLLALIIRSC